MATTFFLRIDGIPGDAVIKGYEGWIQVAGFEGGLSQPLSGGVGGGSGVGRPSFRPFSFTTELGGAAPLLLEACASGRHAKDATLEALHVGESHERFARWDFEEITVTSLDLTGQAESLAESFSLAYARIRITTYAPDPAGGAGTPTARGWDLTTMQGW